MGGFEVTIFHNPACGTSRKALAAIRAAGIEPKIVEYLKTPPTRVELEELLERSGLCIRDILRKKAAPYLALGLDDPHLDDDAIFDAIAKEPILIERPIVRSPKGVALCRPAERVADLLP
jgi:arsenate reductase